MTNSNSNKNSLPDQSGRINHSLSPEKALVFRITHVRNLPWILENGLYCGNSDSIDPDFVPIGIKDLIQKRSRRAVPTELGGVLHDYVPFYFTPYSIMLYNIVTGVNVAQQAKEDIAIVVSSLPKFRESGVTYVYTNRHAVLVNADFFTSSEDLENVDWELLRSRNFKIDPNDPGKNERYQAEALAYQHVPVDALSGVVCYSQEVQREIDGECAARSLNLQVESRPGWYF